MPVNPERLIAHADFVRILAKHLTKNNDIADELTQEMILKALKNPPENNSDVVSWLTTSLKSYKFQSKLDRRKESDTNEHRCQGENKSDKCKKFKSMNYLGKFPRVWELFPFLLRKKTRDQIYEPAHEELKEDWALTRKKYRTKWAKRWITFCFTLRTVFLFINCIWIMVLSSIGNRFKALLPEKWQKAWPNLNKTDKG